MHKIFSNKTYQISMREIDTIGEIKRDNEEFNYAIYIENNIVHLLIDISLYRYIISGLGKDVFEYCTIEEFETKTIKEIKDDIYKFYLNCVKEID